MKQHTVHFSIRWKLLSIMLCMLVSVLTVSTYLQIVNQKQILNRELALQIDLVKKKLVSRANTLSVNLSRQVETGLATVNLSKISEVLKKSVEDDKELNYAILMDNSARAYIHTLKPVLALEILEGKVDQFALMQEQLTNYEHAHFGIPVIEFIVPLQISVKPWGVLRLGFSMDILKKETIVFQKKNDLKIQEMIKHSIYLACIFIVISAVIILILSDRLSRPLRRLTKATNKLASGDFTAANSIKTSSRDEIGVLENAFFEMSKDLESSYLELQNYNLKLEQIVQERTVELVRIKDEAIKANQIKSGFLSMVSHEIRTPMNVISGLTQILLKTDLSTRQYDSLNKVKTSADSLLLIIDDLLDMSKIEAGHLGIEIINFNLEDVLKKLNTLVENKVEEKNLALVFSLADDIPLFLLGDPFRLGQVLLNLVSNAIKFTEEGTIQVTVELVKPKIKGESDMMLWFSVQDSGVGLSQKQINNLFKPFSQADISISRLYGGTGLGLSISKHLVELMGGNIGIESELGAGCNFIFTVSFRQGNEIDSKEKQVVIDGNISDQLTIENNRGEGRKLLIVDDYPLNQEVAKSLLEDKGFTISLADSGQQATRMVKETHYDAVLMDLQMPGMDGYEATRLIRSDSRFSDLPIIALTAYAENDGREKCLNKGMTDCVNKPIDTEQLVFLLNKYINSKSNADINFDEDQIKPKNINILNSQLAGINLQELLSRVTNDEQVCYKLLTAFERQFSDVLQRINSSILADDKVLAGQLAHGLNGVASNLAAFKLATAAGEIEKALNQQPYDLERPIMHCEQALRQVLSDIKTITSNSQNNIEILEHNKEPDYVQATKLLTRLIELIKLNRLDADLAFDDLNICLSGTKFSKELKKLKRVINLVDYKSALLFAKEIEQILPQLKVETSRELNEVPNKFRILIVDDIPINIKALAQVLRDKNMIQIVSNGEDALLLSRTIPQPDLILLDIEMPRLDGYEVCLKLKENDATEAIPVIFVTARIEAVDERVGLEMGAIDYITKPCNTSVVQARINTHIELIKRRVIQEKFANFDSLTGISNRHMFNNTLDQEWKRALRAQKPLSLIFIDVDYFKNFNDFYGHTTGDQCLSIIAKTLLQSLKRNSDFIARFGGEEFVVILPETDTPAAHVLAESMRTNIEDLKLPHTPTKDFNSVTISLGLATVIPKPGIKVDDLLKTADNAVYEAKFSGRNQVKEILMTEFKDD